MICARALIDENLTPGATVTGVIRRALENRRANVTRLMVAMFDLPDAANTAPPAMAEARTAGH